MLRNRRGFTLVELIVVVAIIATISAILFPVLAAAKGSANRVACVSNLRQISQGTHLYTVDYDDRLMPVNHQPASDPNSRNDRTWVQSLLPYVRNFAVFRCPSDHSPRPRLEATFDLDLVPGDTDSQYYSASLRSNYGYNYQNLSPILQEGTSWVARPRLVGEVTDPSQTIVFLDSVWQQDGRGNPQGGGNWLVVPPCRFYRSSVDSFTGSFRGPTVYAPVQGWKVTGSAPAETPPIGETQPPSNAPTSTYGNAFPWHAGKMNVARLDGSIRLMSPANLGDGCEVRDAWQGKIGDPVAYQWDVR